MLHFYRAACIANVQSQRSKVKVTA